MSFIKELEHLSELVTSSPFDWEKDYKKRFRNAFLLASKRIEELENSPEKKLPEKKEVSIKFVKSKDIGMDETNMVIKFLSEKAKEIEGINIERESSKTLCMMITSPGGRVSDAKSSIKEIIKQIEMEDNCKFEQVLCLIFLPIHEKGSLGSFDEVRVEYLFFEERGKHISVPPKTTDAFLLISKATLQK